MIQREVVTVGPFASKPAASFTDVTWSVGRHAKADPRPRDRRCVSSTPS
jgi:hypothetical protein